MITERQEKMGLNLEWAIGAVSALFSENYTGSKTIMLCDLHRHAIDCMCLLGSSHVLAGVTFFWGTSTPTHMFIPVLWTYCIAGSAPTTAHMSSGASASHTRPKLQASIMEAWRARIAREKLKYLCSRADL